MMTLGVRTGNGRNAGEIREVGRHHGAPGARCRDWHCDALYLDLAWKELKPQTREHPREAIFQGAVKRIRLKMMTVTTILAGLLPVLSSQGTGADVMKRIAAPMVGGVVTSALVELVVYPAIYMLCKAHLSLAKTRSDVVDSRVSRGARNRWPCWM